ncbi:acyl-CoA dehydrogenase family protein [Pelomonas sp. KK5]|uniref:acyl-CoA dehydrogenase family protein n=1 Tax=Pelomonas sp. KK5 TaxID=1855730 RepID=UPI00097C2BF9|nr:acyl-CoA dehydrogenase family protein [Pelomonas sp. KK5]
MDFNFTSEQVLLRDSLRAFLADCCPLEARHEAARQGPGWRPELWRRLGTELGILGAAFPEALGGSGGGAYEHLVIMEELGAALALEPYVESIVLAGGLLQRAGGAAARDLLPGLLAGERALAVGLLEPGARQAPARVETSARREGEGWRLDGHKAAVVAAPWASHLIVSARTSGGLADERGISLFLVERERAGLTLRPFHTIDGRRAADVVLDGVRLPPTALLGEEGDALGLIEQANDEAIAAQCAEAVGLMSRMLADTVAYTRERKQFGQVIASFQALQHRMADMLMQLELARSAVYRATQAVASAPANERAMAVSAAKVTVDQALRYLGQNAVQLHGGMGMSDEVAVTTCFRRATVLGGTRGSVEHHLDRFSRLERNLHR